MGKSDQIGKAHNYPSSRRSYATSRTGVGGRPKKKEVLVNKTSLTYFDKLRKIQQQKQG